MEGESSAQNLPSILSSIASSSNVSDGSPLHYLGTFYDFVFVPCWGRCGSNKLYKQRNNGRENGELHFEESRSIGEDTFLE